jgi:polysaccharide biosynthesis protein PslH
MRQAIVIGLPWLRSGSGQVMESQVRWLKRLGFRVTFAAVASHYDGGFDEAEWRQFEEFAPDLGADRVVISKFEDLNYVRRGVELAKALATHQNAMHWALAPAHLTQPAAELLTTDFHAETRLIIANHVYTVPFALRLRSLLGGAGPSPPLMIFTHDVQTHIILDRKAKAPWRRRIESENVLFATELEWLSKGDALVHVSSDDEALFQKALPTRKHALILPGFEPMAISREKYQAFPKRDLLHVAGSHPGNVESIHWYLRNVMPLLGNEPPRHTFVGKICDHEKAFFPDGTPPWVEMAGQVKSLDPYYASARWAICPTISGRGISVKTIEAFAAGVPVIGMPLAFRGMPEEALRNAGIRPVSDARSFADAVKASSSALLREEKALASREIFLQLFDAEASFAAFKKILASLSVKA